jgi:hypothetical protein
VGFREICCEIGKWMKMAHDGIQWWTLVVAMLNLWVLLPDSWIVWFLNRVSQTPWRYAEHMPTTSA